jgi:hypothetical protein
MDSAMMSAAGVRAAPHHAQVPVVVDEMVAGAEAGAGGRLPGSARGQRQEDKHQNSHRRKNSPTLGRNAAP